MAERVGFDLISEPWIAVTDEHGHAGEASLQDIFRRAGSLTGLRGDLPTQDFAVLRLALAILQRALHEVGPATEDDVPALLAALDAAWDESVVPTVLDYLDRHLDRFDLFHPSQPFFQVADMRTTKGEIPGIAKLIADMPAGRPYLTMRSRRAARCVPPGEAARWLVHAQAFDASGIKTGVLGHPRARNGKVFPEGVAWAGQLGGLHLVGDTLKSTLLLNLWAVALPWEERDEDIPPWERPVQGLGPSEHLDRRPAGPVDLYTWQPRRVLLNGDRGGVTGVLITYGDAFTVQERQRLIRLEAMTLWRFSKPQTQKFKRPIQMPRTHQPAVALWRGLASVVPRAQKQDEQGDAPCLLVEHAARLAIARSPLLPRGLVHYRAVGVVYGSNNSVIDEVVADSLDLPALVLDPAQVELRQVALNAVDAAKKGVAALAELARGLARASGAGPDESRGPGDRAYETGFAVLDAPYRDWLRTLAESVADPTAAEAQWQIVASGLVWRLGEEQAANVPDKAWIGFSAQGPRPDVGAAFRRFSRDLSRAFPLARPGDRRPGGSTPSADIEEEP